MHGGVEDRAPVAAERLCTVHGDVGVSHQIFAGALHRRADRDADARAHEGLLPIEADRHTHRFPDAFGDPHRVTRIAEALQENGELVTSDSSQRLVGVIVARGAVWSRDGVLEPQDLGQPARDFEQQLIAGQMAGG